jgi:hypothetical protein
VSERRPTVLLRRDILKIGGSATLLPLASVLGLTAPIQRVDADARALELKSFDRAQSGLLLSVTRTLFPHDFLPDEQYMKIVAVLDAKAAADKSVAMIMGAALSAFPDDFATMEEVKREDYLRTLEGSPFFRLVYQETLVGLYGDPAVSALLGYEGSSVEHGGYLERGFDDISWLPTNKPLLK